MTHGGKVPWYLWPFVALWRLLAFILGLTGRILGIVLGLVLVIVGIVISLTVVGAVVGIPLAIVLGVVAGRGLILASGIFCCELLTQIARTHLSTGMRDARL